MICKNKRSERYETLKDYIDHHAFPWNVGDDRGDIDAEVVSALRAARDFSRLAIPKDADHYESRVEHLFSAVLQTTYWDIKTTYATRDTILGESNVRSGNRKQYAAPNGTPETAYTTGMETYEETAPMHENIDRALTAQDGLKDWVDQAVKAFDVCFYGVLS